MIIYLPADLSLEHAVLEIGAGSLYLDAVPVTCENMDVEIGAGKTKMKGVTTGRLNVECGVGSCVYEGRVNGDIKVNCGVGNCSFQLENKEGDFNYDVSCAVGNVRINGNRLKGLASKKSYKNESALGTAILECGVGNIEFRTKI